MEKQTIQELIQIGSIDEAKRLMSEFEQTNPTVEDVEIYTIKAAIAVAENNLQEAEDQLLKGILLDPNYDDLLFNLGYVYKLRGDYSQSSTYFEKALAATKNIELIDLIKEYITENNSITSTTKPLVSIVILAYNKLEYTKLCIESIYRFTSNIDYELIAVNNASTDGTQEYFESLPGNVRVIHLPRNLGPVGGFNEGLKAARGKYTAAVCNDFIFTPRWMDNLLACIKSDPTIGFVSPGANYISNHQKIDGTYTNIDEMLEFAEQYNHSDPRKWEERVRLLPCVLMAPTDLLRDIGYFDTRFYFGEFADDDISFRIRRAGYKLVFCRDTFTYHFGSVTVGTNQVENNSLQVSREIFKEKHGIDSWSEAGYSPQLLGALSVRLSDYKAKILGINTRCGGNPLQLKNMLRERGVSSISITNYCLNEKYLIDLNTVSDHVIVGDLTDISKHVPSTETFDYVVFEHEAGVFQGQPELLSQLSSQLDFGGQMAVSLSYSKVEQSSMQADVQAIAQAGFQVMSSIVVPNATNGYDLLITARKGV
ncbi:glycosyltransferase family 2 protein [Paenibacillus sediminis]|uniref:GT2 family glycosyltransferase n=1 Tax=Paenibacillus sediminis TaxID=664909 RepID=A0ABS4H2G2_9BACL|nr:glycosyltransferase family 2 protein [Paenibacillus sediminis]MBP1936651.1 GT2 family glycosyltransferase [Paenibacillus sediminis]